MKRRGALFVRVALSIAVVPFFTGCKGEGLSATPRSSSSAGSSDGSVGLLGQSITTGSMQGYYWYDGPNGLNSGSIGTRPSGSSQSGSR